MELSQLLKCARVAIHTSNNSQGLSTVSLSLRCILLAELVRKRMDGRWPHEISKETIRVLGVGVEGCLSRRLTVSPFTVIQITEKNGCVFSDIVRAKKELSTNGTGHLGLYHAYETLGLIGHWC